MEIKYINARVDVMRKNVENKESNPVYWAFDADDNKVGECHVFMGANATLTYVGRSAKFTYPRVCLLIEGEIVLDPALTGQRFAHRLVPSSRGMYKATPQPIKDEDGNVYLSCKIEGAYMGVCDVGTRDTPLYLDCDSFKGLPA